MVSLNSIIETEEINFEIATLFRSLKNKLGKVYDYKIMSENIENILNIICEEYKIEKPVDVANTWRWASIVYLKDLEAFYQITKRDGKEITVLSIIPDKILQTYTKLFKLDYDKIKK